MWVKDIEESEKLPFKISKKKNLSIEDRGGYRKYWRRDRRNTKVKAKDMSVYELAYQIINNYVGKKFNDAYSEFCSLTPKSLRFVFDDCIVSKTHYHYSGYWYNYYVENGIIRERKLRVHWKRKGYKYTPFTMNDKLMYSPTGKITSFGYYHLEKYDLYKGYQNKYMRYRFLNDYKKPEDRIIIFNNRSNRYKQLRAEDKQKRRSYIRKRMIEAINKEDAEISLLYLSNSNF